MISHYFVGAFAALVLAFQYGAVDGVRKLRVP